MTTKSQNAERIAMEARVFVRKARRGGHANLITGMLFAECAQVLGLYGTDGWTIRKAARLTVAELEQMNELGLIDWNDSVFAAIKPRWMR